LEAYLEGQRLNTYNVILARIRNMGLRAIIEGCERDLGILRKLERKETAERHDRSLLDYLSDQDKFVLSVIFGTALLVGIDLLFSQDAWYFAILVVFAW